MSTEPALETVPEVRRIVVLVHSAIAGASLAGTFALVTRDTLGNTLLIALGCFAVAIPAAIAMVILSQVIYEAGLPSDTNQSWPALSYVMAVIDQVACYLGFLLMFWFFHWVIGAVFLVATALALATTWKAEMNMRERLSQLVNMQQDAPATPE